MEHGELNIIVDICCASLPSRVDSCFCFQAHLSRAFSKKKSSLENIVFVTCIVKKQTDRIFPLSVLLLIIEMTPQNVQNLAEKPLA